MTVSTAEVLVWHAVDSSLPDNGANVLIYDALGTVRLGWYDGTRWMEGSVPLDQFGPEVTHWAVAKGPR